MPLDTYSVLFCLGPSRGDLWGMAIERLVVIGSKTNKLCFEGPFRRQR